MQARNPGCNNSDSRRWFKHGEEVQGDVDDSGKSDYTTADVKDGVVAESLGISVYHISQSDTDLSIRTPSRR